jgi:hypothetical protein
MSDANNDNQVSLYFEDWTGFFNEAYSNPWNKTRFIRVFGALGADQISQSNPKLAVYPISGEPLVSNERFLYGNKLWVGKVLESQLNDGGLPESALTICRALFRFANLPQIDHVRTSMEARNEVGDKMITNPLDVINRVSQHKLQDEALMDPRNLYLSIFMDNTVNNLLSFLETNTEGDLMSFVGESVEIQTLRRLDPERYRRRQEAF